MKINGAHVLLTGASGGIGQALASQLASSGAKLSLAGRNETTLSEVAKQFEGSVHKVDLTDAHAAGRLFWTVEEEDGPIDIVINNAGLRGRADIWDLSAEEIQRFFAVNAIAPALILRAAIPAFRQRHHGYIVNMSSVSATIAPPHSAVYSATKAALTRLHRGLELDCRDTDLHFLLVEAGYVKDNGSDSRKQPPRTKLRGLTSEMSVERLARSIVKAIEHDRRNLRLPRRMGLASAVGNLPSRVVSPLLARKSHKS